MILCNTAACDDARIHRVNWRYSCLMLQIIPPVAMSEVIANDIKPQFQQHQLYDPILANEIVFCDSDACEENHHYGAIN
jgi:hypothetical protein